MKPGVLTCPFITHGLPPIPWDHRVSGAPRGTQLKSCLRVHLGPGAIALNCLLLFALVNHPTLPLKLSHVWLWPLSFSHLCYGFRAHLWFHRVLCLISATLNTIAKLWIFRSLSLPRPVGGGGFNGRYSSWFFFFFKSFFLFLPSLFVFYSDSSSWIGPFFLSGSSSYWVGYVCLNVLCFPLAFLIPLKAFVRF